MVNHKYENIRHSPVQARIDELMDTIIKNMQKELIRIFDDPTVKYTDASRAVALKIMGLDYIMAIKEKKKVQRNNTFLAMV
jgi:hypothetical protein